MFVDILKSRLLKNKKNKSLVIDNQIYCYNDILDSWDSWSKSILEHKIDPGSVVMVRGEFNVGSIGLMLSLIENQCIYVPVSYAAKDVEKFKGIAEIEHYFDLQTGAYEKTDLHPANELILKLKKRNHPGLVLFSSGSTGEPKAALHDLIYMLEKYEAVKPSFTSIAFLLFDHIGGFNTVLYGLSTGGTIVVPAERSPEYILSMIESYQVQVLPTSPSFLNLMLVTKSYEKYNLDSLKVITYGTEPMLQTTLERLNKVFPNVKIKQTYGLSEVGILRSQSKNSGSLWMRIGGDENHKVEVRDGILWIKSKMSMLGYLNAESPFDKEGWFNTQDRVEVDEDYFKILGRVTNIINVGGEKVYPSEVESVILMVPHVEEVVVKGEPHPLMGNVVVCHVQINAEADQREIKKKIKTQCSKHLEKFKRPIKILFTSKSFYTERFKKDFNLNA